MINYICIEKEPLNKFESISGLFENKLEAIKFAQRTNSLIFELLDIPDYSEFEFWYDEDSEFDDTPENYEGDQLEWLKSCYPPMFFIKNKTDPDDDRDCGPDGWVNAMEYCYEAPRGLTKEQARQCLLDLGMKEIIN